MKRLSSRPSTSTIGAILLFSCAAVPWVAACSSDDGGTGNGTPTPTPTGTTPPTPTPTTTGTTPPPPAPATCTDAIKNGTEADVDCGGSCATKCAEGKGCAAAADCTTSVCSGGKCVAATCADTAKNGTETDVDCGGSCGKCADTKTCAVAADCTSVVCDAGTKKCLAPLCTDTVKNGTESDVDCGGSCTTKCANAKTCAVAGDCTSGVCNSGSKTCTPAACTDTVKNGTETDVDCGGSCTTKCADTKKCLVGADCTSLNCDAGAKTCTAPTCSDVLKNGTETDVDCGGSCTTKCVDTKKCLVGADCASGVCDSVAKTCTLSTGLLTYWNLNDAVGAASAADSGPNNIPAVVAGTVTFAAAAGVQGSGAAQFTGAGSLRATFPNNARGDGAGVFIAQGNISFAMWFKTAAAGQNVGGLQTVIGTTWGGGFDRIVGNSSASGGGILNYNMWSEVNPAGNVAVNDGNYHHLVYVTDKVNGQLSYIDGALEMSSLAPTTNCGIGCSGFDWASDYWFGTGNNGRFGAGDFVGTMDEVRIYDRVLTAGEIATLYTSTK